MCRTWTSWCSRGSDSFSLSFSLLSLSVPLPVPIPLAPVKFSFSHSPCLSQPLKGIAVGHIISLLPLSALSIPLLHSSCLRGCLFKPLFSFPPSSAPTGLCLVFASLQSVPNIALFFMRQDGLSSAHTAAGSPKSKYHIML